MNTLWLRTREQLGDIALAAIALMVAGVLFLALSIRPLEARLAQLEAKGGPGSRHGSAQADRLRQGTPAAKLAGFYAFFDRPEGQVDWLAKLYGSARAAGVEFRSAEYRLIDSNGRIARYEVTLPLAGSYLQVRDFLENALAEVPILSLDQITLRRKRPTDAQIEAEAVMTLHLLKP